MKQTIGQSQFIEEFRTMGRYDQFGYDALVSLFDYFEQYEQDKDEEIELDVIAICCEYSVDSVDDIASNYGIDLSDCEDDDEKREAVLDYLNDNTQVVDGDCNGQIVYQQF
jgi:hypothetical protein